MKLEEMSGVELGAEVRSGNITPTEVVDYFADRIEKRNLSLNAFVYTKTEDALHEAKKLEARLAKGEDCGPLAGVPIAVENRYALVEWLCRNYKIEGLKPAFSVRASDQMLTDELRSILRQPLGLGTAELEELKNAPLRLRTLIENL